MRRETSSMLDVELKQILDKVALIKCFKNFAKVVLFERPIIVISEYSRMILETGLI